MEFLNQLKEWQTLISGVFAVIATFVGAYLLWKQTAQTKSTIEDQRLRELDKARTLAQFHLSALWGAIEDFADELPSLLETGHRADPHSFDEWPPAALEALANLQLHCSDKDRRMIGDLFQKMQVLQSRLNDRRWDLHEPYGNFEYIWLENAWMLAEVKSLVSALFDYCRFTSTFISDFDNDLDTVETTMLFWDIDLTGDPMDPKSRLAIVRRWKESKLATRKPPPWYSRPVRN